MAKVKALGETYQVVSEKFVKTLSHMFRSSYQKHSWPEQALESYSHWKLKRNH